MRKFLNISFSFWQSLGFHVIAVHFYSPVPDTRGIRDDFWEKKSSMAGIDLRESEQIGLLNALGEKFKKEYEGLVRHNTEFGPVDAEMLYCMIREKKPKKIIEIGSGYSTMLMIEAIKKNDIQCNLVSIDPYPKDFILAIKEPFFTLIKREVQEIPLKDFKSLHESDILFIDSSHILKIGSDVQYEYLEILPNLSSGVMVHIHDIFLPREYPKNWVKNEHTFFNEQYLLQAFLAYNKEFEVMWSANFISQKHPELLKKAFNSYLPGKHRPGSFWIKRK